MTHTELLKAQIENEKGQLDAGRERFLKQQDRIQGDKGFGSRDDVSKVIKGCLPKVSKALLKYLKSKGTKAKFYINLLDIDLVSLIALTGCFNGVQRQTSLNTITVNLGKAVEAEVWGQALNSKDKRLYGRLVNRATKTHGAITYRHKALRATAAKEGYNPVTWDQDLKAKVGEPLLNAVLKACPEVFELYDTEGGKGKNTTKYIGLTTEASDLLSSITEFQAWMHPSFKPMLVPPRPWTSFYTGAYVTRDLSSKVQLVRTHDQEHIELVKEAIADGSMDKCLKALNLIQETPWAINEPILDLVRWAWEQNISIDGFPLNQHLPPPPHPKPWETMNENEQKAWRIRAARVALKNRGIDGDRVTMLGGLSVAEGLRGAQRFYLPHSLDFRGRVYAVPSYNGQRADHIRATLRFADGLALGDSGAYWLAVHVANCGDFDGISKGTLDARFAWTIDNEELIQSIAREPYDTVDIWRRADKPFQFVAACIEYAGFLEHGESFVSHLPIALDGSNSGLQHYSASLRSPEGALVNLVPSDKPADLYQSVADLTVKAMGEDAAEGSEIAKLCLKNGVTRKLVKRNAMTFSYSSGEYGFKQQHMTDLMEPLALKVLSGELPSHPYGEDGGFEAAGYIAKKTYKAITSLVKDAATGMKFFQKCATSLAHEGKGLTWITPTGLPVTHRYTEWDSKTVKMFLYDKAIPVIQSSTEDKVEDGDVLKQVRLTIRTKPTSRINKAKAKSAVAPNVIHSLDASHLMLTVLKAKEQGISSFSLIHDSFGTHAANTSDFFYTIREAFVEMYESYCPYETIRECTLNALDNQSKVPQVPQKGSLNVKDVSTSLYAFA